MKIYLKTLEELKEKIEEGIVIHWIIDRNVVYKTSNKTIVVNIPKNKEKYTAFKISTVIKKFGFSKFYYLKEQK